jgi:hypothetical protein
MVSMSRMLPDTNSAGPEIDRSTEQSLATFMMMSACPIPSSTPDGGGTDRSWVSTVTRLRSWPSRADRIRDGSPRCRHDAGQASCQSVCSSRWRRMCEPANPDAPVRNTLVMALARPGWRQLPIRPDRAMLRSGYSGLASSGHGRSSRRRSSERSPSLACRMAAMTSGLASAACSTSSSRSRPTSTYVRIWACTLRRLAFALRFSLSYKSFSTMIVVRVLSLITAEYHS